MSEAFFTDSEISKEAVAAIAAHEQGHIKNGDVKLCEYIQKLSGIVLVGQNPLYELFDFRNREIQADRYAVESVGYEPYREALDYLSLHSRVQKTGQDMGANMLPSFDSDAAKKNLLGLFDLLFGNFAMAESHPDVENRKEKMKKYVSDS